MRRQFADYDRDGDGLVSLEEAHGVLQCQLGDRRTCVCVNNLPKVRGGTQRATASAW